MKNDIRVVSSESGHGLARYPWDGNLSLAMTGVTKLDWNLGALAAGLRCYRSQEFFLAHEHWESVWLKCQEPERSFLQALIQTTSAFHHLQRNNSKGAASLLNKALRRLDTYPALFAGVEVNPLREQLRAWLRILNAHDSPIHPSFPNITLTTQDT
jgi:hypothetical protein